MTIFSGDAFFSARCALSLLQPAQFLPSICRIWSPKRSPTSAAGELAFTSCTKMPCGHGEQWHGAGQLGHGVVRRGTRPFNAAHCRATMRCAMAPCAVTLVPRFACPAVQRHGTLRCALPWCTMPCCAMPCHATPCHAMLCHIMSQCTMPCCAVPCHTVPCHAVPCHATPCLVMLCHIMSQCTMPCCTMPCHTVPCHAVPCHGAPCRAVLWPCHTVPCHAVPYHVTVHCAMLCHATPYCAMPRHTVPCRAVPCHATPCHVMPCHIMSQCTMPCHTMLCHATLCCAMPCHSAPHHAVPCHTTLYHVMPCHTMPQCTVPCHATPCHTVLCPAIVHHAMLHRATPHRAMPRCAISCHSAPRRAVPCRATRCHAVHGPVPARPSHLVDVFQLQPRLAPLVLAEMDLPHARLDLCPPQPRVVPAQGGEQLAWGGPGGRQRLRWGRGVSGAGGGTGPCAHQPSGGCCVPSPGRMRPRRDPSAATLWHGDPAQGRRGLPARTPTELPSGSRFFWSSSLDRVSPM